jgi:hypothetical protein
MFSPRVELPLAGSKLGTHRLIAAKVVRAEKVESAVGECDAEAKCRVGRVLLEDPYFGGRLAALDQRSEIEPRRTALTGIT